MANTKNIKVVVAVIFLIVIAYLVAQSMTHPQTSTQTHQTQPQGISVSQIQIKNLKLSCAFNFGTDGTGDFPNCGSGGFILKGEVTNNSSISFQTIYMTVDAYDCPDTTITSDCSHIGQDKYVDLGVDGDVSGDFPPNQVREAIAVAVNLSGMPPIHGNFEWTYGINPCSPPNYLAIYCGFWNGYELIPATQ